MDPEAFDNSFTKSVPHILEKILLFLDYETFKKCSKVSIAWNEILMSKSFQRKAKSVFQEEIEKDQEDLWWAVKKSNTEEIMELLNSGFLDVDFIYHSRTHIRSSLLLSNAAVHAHIDVVKLLLDKGAEVDITNNYGDHGDTALILAALYDRIDVVMVLLDHGADPNKANRYGQTPLFYATASGIEMVRLLTNAGAKCTNASEAWRMKVLEMSSQDSIFPSWKPPRSHTLDHFRAIHH